MKVYLQNTVDGPVIYNEYPSHQLIKPIHIPGIWRELYEIMKDVDLNDIIEANLTLAVDENSYHNKISKTLKALNS